MNKEEFDHVIRAAGSIIDASEVLVIGSPGGSRFGAS